MYKLIFALLILAFPLNALGASVCCQPSQKEISEPHKPCHDNNSDPSENAGSTCQNICVLCGNLTFLIYSEPALSNLNSGSERIVIASSINTRTIKPPLKPPKLSEFVFLINTNSI
jgi:hypothetical protein